MLTHRYGSNPVKPPRLLPYVSDKSVQPGKYNTLLEDIVTDANHDKPKTSPLLLVKLFILVSAIGYALLGGVVGIVVCDPATIAISLNA
jgi:hypothetical protein